MAKPNDSYHAYRNYKPVNKCIEDDGHKVSNANDLFAKLPLNGTVFSVLLSSRCISSTSFIGEFFKTVY